MDREEAQRWLNKLRGWLNKLNILGLQCCILNTMDGQACQGNTILVNTSYTFLSFPFHSVPFFEREIPGGDL